MKRFALVFLVACSTTSTPVSAPPAPTPSASTTASPSVTASAAVSASGPAPATCSSDGDCSKFSSYCGDLPCACVPYLTSGGAPKCNQPSSVKCFVDPCLKKTAACQDGKCVITAGAAQAR
jgi:hypothetical protein